MRHLPVFHALPVMLLLACSAGSGPGPAVTSSGASDAVSPIQATPASTILAAYDITFIARVGYFTGAEAAAGQLAINEADAPALHAFGHMLLEDGLAANRALERIAAAKNVQAPLALDGQRRDALKVLQSQVNWRFDQAFVADQIAQEEKGRSLFEDATRRLQDPDLRAYATQTLPTIARHLEQLQTIAPSVAGGQAGGA